MKKIISILAVIAALCLVSAALADDTDRFLGKWICHNVIVDGKTIPIKDIDAELELAVRTDGTALVYIKQEHIVDQFEGAWLAEGNDILVTDGSSFLLFSLNAEGDLILRGEGAEFILVRQHTLQIDAEHFPDERFREYVKHYDFTRDGLLNDEEIRCARDFQMQDRDIHDLTGIEIFTNITDLICSGNQLTKLDLSKNTKLVTLYCGNNQLTELDVSKCTKLVELVCGENQLTKLDVSKCKALREFECSHNMLTKLNVNSNKKLERLWCDHNQLTSVNVSKNTKLIQLSMSYNQLTSVDVSRNAALLGLYVTGNKLTDIDVSHNPLLGSLSCGGNPLTKLDLSKNPEITHLSCEGIGLTKLDVSGQTKLRRLVCGDNPLTKLDLSKNPDLEQLDCSGDLLTVLDLSKNKKLTDLKCSGNHLAALDLSKNKDMFLNEYHVACGGNRFPVTTKDGTIPFTDLPGFNIKKAASIKFTADSGAKKAFKKTKTAFVVKEGGVITYTYKVDSARAFTETFSIRVDFLKPDITSVTLRKKSYAYTGGPIEPTMVVKAKVDGKAITLTKDDYTVAYENNVDIGTATVTVTGQGHYQGTITKTFTITPVKILKVTLSNYELPYNGRQRKPIPTVTTKVGGKLVTLEKNVDYTVKYENNIEPGTATVTVTGIGNYKGTITKTFTVREP